MQSSGQSGSSDALIHLTPSSLPLAIVQAAAAAAAASSGVCVGVGVFERCIL